ncbi:MAG: hypothetical protein LKF96_03675 [Treponema sp.]|jgi:integrase|nr:hypothetical protein [Treponema sp.]
MTEIYEEAIWQGIPVQQPAFIRFKRNSKRQSVLSTRELETLFVPRNFSSEMFYVFYLLCVSAGMRLGEVRAFRKCQFNKDKKAIIIDGFLSANGVRNPFNKTGSSGIRPVGISPGTSKSSYQYRRTEVNTSCMASSISTKHSSTPDTLSLI